MSTGADGPSNRPSHGPAPDAEKPLPLRRRWLHLLFIVLGWLLFAWSWQRVTADRPDAGLLRVLMLGALVVVPVFTLAWVVHNVGIYRRKGPRRAVPVVERPYERDFNGRRIDADWAAMAQARRIVIQLDGDTKRYLAPGFVPGRIGPAAADEERSAHVAEEQPS